MTKLNLVDDRRTPVDTAAGPGKIGSYYTKVQDGEDYPKTRYAKDYMKLINRNTGVLHYKWIKPPRRALNTDHPYTMSLVSSADNVMAYSSDTGVRWSSCTFENAFGPPSFTAKWDANDDIKLLGKLRESIVGVDFNPAVFLAEGRQALRMIFESATRVGYALHAARKGNWKAAADALVGGTHRQKLAQKTANNWLELQYGWLPLLKDAHDGAEFLAHLTSAPFQTTVTVTRTKMSDATASHLRFLGKESKHSVKIRALLKEVDIIGLSGLSDPAEVLWEKLPYSFVADWFIPIGNYLAARGLAQSLKGTFVRTEYKRLRVRGKNAKSIYPYFLIRDSAYAYTMVSVVRTVSTSLSVPLPTVKPLNKALTWRHAENAVALVTQKAVPAYRDIKSALKHRNVYTD